jgi:hypothetical protein
MARKARPRRGYGGSVAADGSRGARFWLTATGRLARHPSLWPTAVRQAGRLSRPGWWRRPPFVPLPDRDYLRFRLETQYGATGIADPDDLVVYLRWCRDEPTMHPPGAA